MTDTALRAAQASGPVPAHPLEPAGPAEYLAGRDILAAAGLLAEPVRFAYYGLEEPAKDEVLGPAGEPPDRRLRAFLINVTTGESCDVVVSLTRRQVVSRRVLDPRADGQVPIIDQDFATAVEGRDGPARAGRRDQDPGLPADRRVVRVPGRGRAAAGPGPRVRAGRRARLRLGAPGGRRGRLRGPGRAAGRRAGGRVRPAGT